MMKAMAATGTVSSVAGCMGDQQNGGTQSGQTTSGDNDQTSANTQKNQGGELVMGLRGEPRNLSYWQSYTYYENNVTTNIWEPLFNFGPEAPYELEPALATNMEIEDDTHFVFDLREGVRFHNGSEMTAEDVKASVEWVQNPDAKASLAWFFTNLDTINVIDDYTVEFVLSKPDAIMKFVPGTIGAAVAPKKQIEEKGLELGQQPIGAGPWKLDEWKSGNYITLTRHDKFYKDDRPYLDKITFEIEPSSTSRVTGMKDGSFDTIDGFPPTQADTLKNMQNVDLYDDVVAYGAASFTYNQTKEPFDKTKVRRAVSHAIDVDKMVKSTVGEYGRRAYSMIPEEMEFGYVGPDDLEHNAFPKDKAKAKKLLDEAGLTGSPRFETEIHVPNSTSARKVAKVVQAELSKVNIDVSIKKLTTKQWFQEWFGKPAEEQAPMLFTEWLSDFPDPQPLLGPLYRTGSTNNWTGYSNKEVDKLLDTLRHSLDREERANAAKKANKIIVDDAVYLWMYHSVYLRAFKSRYKGFIQRPPFFEYWPTMFEDVHDTQA